MALTKDYKEMVLARIQNDDSFARAMFAEAIRLIVCEGDPHTGLSMLRDLIHAKITFKRLSEETGIGEKSLHRMLSARGNPTTSRLSGILAAIAHDLGYTPTIAA
jgi:DNA-binding phage protein